MNKNKKSNLDEMQEQKLLVIEHNGCWLAFWGLLAALIVQALLGFDIKALAGEWILFMGLALYIGVACMRSGIWDRRLKMDAKTNLAVSLVAALVAGGFLFAYSYLRFHRLQGSLYVGLIIAGISFVTCFGGLTLAARATKKRQEALNAEPEDEA